MSLLIRVFEPYGSSTSASAPELSFFTRLDAILCPSNNPAAQLVLAPGTTTFALPAAPVLELDVHVPRMLDNDLLHAYVQLLDRYEPLIDEAERCGFEDELGNPHHDWPLSDEQLSDLIRYGSSITLQPGKMRNEVSRLGKYLVLPFLWKGDEKVLFRDEAIILEAKSPGEVVSGTLRPDPDKIEAALNGK